jgi:serine/threonine protein phosphatase PrpC
VALYVEDIETNEENNECKMSLFAIFDGHGGNAVSKYLGTHFGEVDPLLTKKIRKRVLTFKLLW